MASTKDLKKRITSVKNTQQTTKAMKMVSASKLRRSQEAILSQRPYANEIAKLMCILENQGMTDGTEGNDKKSTLVVVISADRGLCGGYNSNIIRVATQFLSEKSSQGKPTKCVFIGKKAYEIIRGRMKIDLLHYEEMGPKIQFKKAAEISKKILPLYEQGNFDEVYFIYNEFKNAMLQEVKVDRSLPVAAAEKGEAQEVTVDLTLYEPTRNAIYHSLKEKYFGVQIFKALLEAQASEHGARMSAMENATRNAGDMIRRLTLLYNKQRQALITKELLEIIAGSESQKTT